MKDLHEGILREFADRQNDSYAHILEHVAGLRIVRPRATAEYFQNVRALRKVLGVCACGEPAAINKGFKNHGKRGTRCKECAANRRKAA